MSYSLNVYLNYIPSKNVNEKDPSWISGYGTKTAIKWKSNAYCKEYVKSGDTLFYEGEVEKKKRMDRRKIQISNNETAFLLTVYTIRQ